MKKDNKSITEGMKEWYSFVYNTGLAMLAIGSTLWVGGLTSEKLNPTFKLLGLIVFVLGIFLTVVPSLSGVIIFIRNRCSIKRTQQIEKKK